ncbi:hypothetical protein CUN38_04970 [Enterococcus faecium]|nr:hypothetical protein CUN38_04970 [Enterococcus faecium]
MDELRLRIENDLKTKGLANEVTGLYHSVISACGVVFMTTDSDILVAVSSARCVAETNVVDKYVTQLEGTTDVFVNYIQERR